MIVDIFKLMDLQSCIGKIRKNALDRTIITEECDKASAIIKEIIDNGTNQR